MDVIDQKILYELQLNARLSMKELAKKIYLSSPATTERVRKLEEQGIIKGYKTVVDVEKLEKNITAFVLFQTTKCKELSKFCEEHQDVMECYRVTGQISYIAKVCTASVHTLEDFIDEAMKFGTPSTNIVLSSNDTMDTKLFQQEFSSPILKE
ncbi:Lrp/AsnC family transcriptional regulator [Priestia endophytica]|uniref:Lrp/AsnC family transcriptional regulator n=1 Tax=Priestia endophytica TaxID=135735 RepID=UPI000DCA4B3F|nr:Lrp/AsnC family transcriptional regulator [Priestia endophytica]RAS75427.1 AsnC family transcriptional regulator [Priestia endophytica]